MTAPARPRPVLAGTTLQAGALLSAYRAGTLDPGDVVDEVYARIGARGPDGVWIHLLDREAARAAAAALVQRWLGRSLPPLYGLPFAVKDNVDVAGLPTTAGCPDFARVASEDAPLVRRLLDAGALLVGKTNLDQFATGLSGTRSPYGTPLSPVSSDLVPGGSSSGSAVAVAAGLVTFAVGTDTAGSGRVPAGFTGTVGVKPSRGLVSTRGMVPACRSLDCPSVFALSVADGAAVLSVLAAHDEADPFSRCLPPVLPDAAGDPDVDFPTMRVAVPAAGELEFDELPARLAWDVARGRADRLGTVTEVGLAPFLEAGELLYGGPWLAERWAAVGDFARANPDALDPVVARVLSGGAAVTGVDTFRGQHRLAELRRRVAAIWRDADVLVLPVTPGHPTVAQMLADPVGLNARLGRWTTFANLLDLAVVALPSAVTEAGHPVGVQLIGPAGSDQLLLRVAARWERLTGVAAGCTGHPLLVPGPDAERIVAEQVDAERPAAEQSDAEQSDAEQSDAERPDDGPDRVRVTVVGAHMSGLPLNGQLVGLGGRLVATLPTAPAYRLLALPGGLRPGLVRVAEGGASVEAETWSLPREALGDLLVTVPPPLAIGTVALADGTATLGFVCEAVAASDARDITSAGGWRGHLREQAADRVADSGR